MNLDQAKEYFGSQSAIAAALGIKPPAVSQWEGEIPPQRQMQLERISNGALKADPSCYRPAEQHPASNDSAIVKRA